MAAARVGIALEQHVVARIEENQLMLDALLRELGEDRRNALQVLAAIAYVDADGET